MQQPHSSIRLLISWSSSTGHRALENDTYSFSYHGTCCSKAEQADDKADALPPKDADVYQHGELGSHPKTSAHSTGRPTLGASLPLFARAFTRYYGTREHSATATLTGACNTAVILYQYC
jgi:hypothetical protein